MKLANLPVMPAMPTTIVAILRAGFGVNESNIAILD